MTLPEIIDALPVDIGNALLAEIDATPIAVDASVEEIKKSAEDAVQRVIHLAEEMEISKRLKVYQVLAQVPDAIIEMLK